MQKRIVTLFPTDRGRLTVTRIDDGFIRQGPELFPDALEQGSMVAAGQIRAADASPEQHIAADQKSPFRRIESDAAWRMAGQEKYLQSVFAQFDNLARYEEMQRPPVIFKGHAPLKTHARRKREDRLFHFVEMKR